MQTDTITIAGLVEIGVFVQTYSRLCTRENFAFMQADVTLRGFSGYNTRWINHIIDQIVPQKGSGSQYDLATLWFGANDAALPDCYK